MTELQEQIATLKRTLRRERTERADEAERLDKRLEKLEKAIKKGASLASLGGKSARGKRGSDDDDAGSSLSGSGYDSAARDAKLLGSCTFFSTTELTILQTDCTREDIAKKIDIARCELEDRHPAIRRLFDMTEKEYREAIILPAELELRAADSFVRRTVRVMPKGNGRRRGHFMASRARSGSCGRTTARRQGWGGPCAGH